MRKLTNVGLLGLMVLGFGLTATKPVSAKVGVSVGLYPTERLFKNTHTSPSNNFRKIYDEIMQNRNRVMDGEKRIVLITASATTNVNINFDKVTNDFILDPENFKVLQGSDTAELSPGSSTDHSTVMYDMSKKILSCQNDFNANVRMRKNGNRISLSMLAHSFTCIFRDSIAKVYVKKLSNTTSKVTMRAVFTVKGSTFKKIGGDGVFSGVVRGKLKGDVKREIRSTIEGLKSLVGNLN